MSQSSLPSTCCAIIPARGGSKGIARKNLTPVAGIPLLAHTILAAKRAKRIERVVVTTDDDEISAIAVNWGAEVIRRPHALANDGASSELALLHAIDAMRAEWAYVPPLVAFLQCTSPLTQPEDIDGAIDTFVAAHADSCVVVAPFHYFIWTKGKKGEAVPLNHTITSRPLRQERTAQLQETGSVYVFRTAGFVTAKHRFFGHTILHVVPSERLLEIDEPADLMKADALLRSVRENDFRKLCPNPLDALVMDFDGVLTNNQVVIHQSGEESVICHRGDGLGLEMLRKTSGVPMLIISKETNPVVSMRASKLNIECLQAKETKLEALQMWIRQKGLRPNQIIYVGNDLNDLECMRNVGLSVAPSDSHPRVIAASGFVLARSGGDGAIRELTERIAAALSLSDVYP